MDPDLARAIASDPKGRHRVIVTAEDGLPLDDLLARLPASIDVRHAYRLTPSAAITGRGEVIAKLATIEGIKSIEPDRPVSAR